MQGQLQMFAATDCQKLTLSPSAHLARISAWLESVKELRGSAAVLCGKQYGSLMSADQTFLSGKMLRACSAQTMAQTFGQLSKPLPTLGVIDLNGNCLIRHGFYPKTESASTLSEVLEREVAETVFPLKPKPCGTDEGSEQARNIRTLTAGGNSGGMHSSMTLIQSFGRNEKQKVRIKNNPKHCNTILSHYAKDPSENMIHVAAQRGRNPERPSDRTKGAPMRQTLEINHNGTTNTLTSVAKDNYVVEPYIENENLSGQRFRNSYAGTLRANASHNYQTVNSIRRLTEVECERLQGFSDGWTEYGDYEGVIKKVPATARYKALGNAVTVDVVQAVGEAILEATA